MVLERGGIGESWRSRWDSFTLNTPNWMNRLPGETHDPEPRDAFLSRDEYLARLQRYAADHALPIRAGVAVTRVAATTDVGRFTVATRDGVGEDIIEARTIVVASGDQRVPKIPAFASSLAGDIRQLAVADYRRPDDLPAGAVLVVGSAQSGVQIAEDLLDASRTVYLGTSAVPRIRRRYRGKDILEWMVGAGFYEMTVDQLADPRMRSIPHPQISGVGRYGHTVSLQHLAERGTVLLGRPAAVDGRRILLDDTVGANIAFADRLSAEIVSNIEAGIRRAGAQPPPVEPDPADIPHPDPMSVHSPDAIDLEVAGIGTVIWATGFRGDHGYLDLPVFDDTGLPRHEQGATSQPGVHFLGLPWLTRRKSAIIHGIDADAAMTADRIAEQLVGAPR